MEAHALKQDIVTETVRGWIMDGKYLPGQKLPTDAELSQLFQVNKCTVAVGLNRLVEEKILDRAPRRGSIVRKQQHTMQTTNGVALIFPHEGEVYSDLSRKIGSCLSRKNLFPILVNHLFSNDHNEIISFLNRMTSQSLPFGYLCLGSGFFPYDEIRKNHSLYRNIVFLLDYSNPEFLPNCRYVLIDFEDLGTQVVKYFAERNIKRILFPAHHEISFSNGVKSIQVTIMEGIRKQAALEGITFDEGLFWRTHYGTPCELLLPDAMKASNEKAGIFSYSDSILNDKILPIFSSNHLQIGKDALVLGNYNTKSAKKHGIDSFDMRVNELAKLGTEMLTGSCKEQKIMLQAKLVRYNKTSLHEQY